MGIFLDELSLLQERTAEQWQDISGVAIKALSTDISLVESLSVKAQDTILSLFDDRTYIDKLNKLYKN